MAFVTGRGARADRFPEWGPAAVRMDVVYVGIGWAMARMPWHAEGPRESLPRVLDRDTGRAAWFVGETGAQRVADMIDNVPAHRNEDPRSAAVLAGAPGDAARSAEGVRSVPSAPDGAQPAFETWRRRIAEEFVHQEGVSL